MKGRVIPYTVEELDYIQSVSAWRRADAWAAFCQKFGRNDVCLKNFNALCKRKGWATGRTGRFEKGQATWNKGRACEEGRGGRHPNARRTQFKKGNEPHNTRYLGHERETKGGYIEISVGESNPHTGYFRTYVLKHRWLWEKVNGPVPDGYCLKSIDGNRANCEPTNWQLVPRALLPRLNGGKNKRRLAYDDSPQELKPTLMALAQLEQAATGIQKRNAQ